MGVGHYLYMWGDAGRGWLVSRSQGTKIDERCDMSQEPGPDTGNVLSASS